MAERPAMAVLLVSEKDQEGLSDASHKSKEERASRKAERRPEECVSMVVATYSKLTVARTNELRKTLRGRGCEVQGGKKTRSRNSRPREPRLKRRSAASAVSPSIAYTSGDPVAMAKALSKYAKDTPEFTFTVGVVEGRVISIREIESLASMPSKGELMSKLLFLISAPAQRLVTVMNAVGRNL